MKRILLEFHSSSILHQSNSPVKQDVAHHPSAGWARYSHTIYLIIMVTKKKQKEKKIVYIEEADKVISYIDLFASHVLVVVHHCSSAVQGGFQMGEKGIQAAFTCQSCHLRR